MKGTEKQIKWAQDIIDGAYAALDCMIRNYDRLAQVDKSMALQTLKYDKEAVEETRKAVDAMFAQIENAADIIDKRRFFTQASLEAAAVSVCRR